MSKTANFTPQRYLLTKNFIFCTISYMLYTWYTCGQDITEQLSACIRTNPLTSFTTESVNESTHLSGCKRINPHVPQGFCHSIYRIHSPSINKNFKYINSSKHHIHIPSIFGWHFNSMKEEIFIIYSSSSISIKK